jgi:hypothetical protein
MPHGVRPRVNEAREFLEIAKDFKDAREILREALSNSWDAGASRASLKFSLVPLAGTKKRKIVVEIVDDGDGMSIEPREGNRPSELEGFFNLGDSYKPYGSIGSKGHGTKIYYKSLGIAVDTWKNGVHTHAETEVPPWDSLRAGFVPTYRYESKPDAGGRGTRILVDGFQAKQDEFSSFDALVSYLKWYTVLGAFGQYFNHPRRMDVSIKPVDAATALTVPYGFSFPDEDASLENSAASVCKILGPTKIACGQTEAGAEVVVEVVGALLGENHRSIVPETYSHMGLWLCKDYIRVERRNGILEDVFKGQYYYRSMLIFANCQEFDLTANRNNVRESEEFDLAVSGIKKFCSTLWEDEFTQSFFSAKRKADEDRQKEEEKKREHDRQARWEQLRLERVNRYKGRPNLPFDSVAGAPAKEPQSESETALLLQAMISAKHPALNFRIGDYNTTNGVDLIIEQVDKQMPMLKWAELVHSLERLYKWDHPPEGYHCVICYELGNVKEVQSFQDGQEARLIPKGSKGLYTLHVAGQSIDVYVLRDLLI